MVARIQKPTVTPSRSRTVDGTTAPSSTTPATTVDGTTGAKGPADGYETGAATGDAPRTALTESQKDAVRHNPALSVRGPTRADIARTRPTYVGTVEVDESGQAYVRDPYQDRKFPLAGDAVAAGTVVEVSYDAMTGDVTVDKSLADPGSAKAEMYEIAARHGLDPTFPPSVMAEVAEIQKAPGIQSGVDSGELVDMRDMAFITIDNEDSRDLDQAMFIEKRDDGGYTVHYALADASYYVTPDSELFKEALKRGTSMYLPGLCVPMLPAELSEGLVSLNEGVDRRALVFSMSLDKNGEMESTDVKRACIRSRKKLAYDGVQAYHDKKQAGQGDTDAKHHGHDFTETLSLLQEVGEKRMAIARDRDVPSYHRTPVHVSYQDERGHAFTVVGDERNDVEKWNEQISLMCNIEGARMLQQYAGDPDVQGVFRNHDAPPQQRSRQFAGFVEDLIQARGLDPDVFRWRRDESMADYLARLPMEGPFLRTSEAIHQKAVFTNVGAEFAAEATGHYGVGSGDGYARFSSPMRELVGIFTHQELLDGMLDRTGTAERDEKLRQKVLEVGNGTKRVQSRITKEANKLAIDDLFQQDAELPEGERPVRRGTLMALEKNKAIIRLDEPPIEVKIYKSDVLEWTGRELVADKDHVAVHEGDRAFYVGQFVDVQVVGYDEDKGHWIIVPTGAGD